MSVTNYEPSTADPELYPFSLVLGPNFRSNPPYSLNKGDREVRARLRSLLGTSNPMVLGRLVNILAAGQIRFRDIPEVEPHIGKGVTFNNPGELYSQWGRRGDVGPILGEAMRQLIRSATKINIREE